MKSEFAAKSTNTNEQMARYDSSTIKKNGLTPVRGTTSVSGYLKYGFYDITYKSASDGLIVYTVDFNSARAERAAQTALSVLALAAFVILCSLGAPVPLPA